VRPRSASALTWSLAAPAVGAPLPHQCRSATGPCPDGWCSAAGVLHGRTHVLADHVLRRPGPLAALLHRFAVGGLETGADGAAAFADQPALVAGRGQQGVDEFLVVEQRG